MRATFTCFLLLLAFQFSAIAQSASDVAKSYFDVLQEGDYDKAATFFAPEALEDFREMLNFGDALPEEEAQQLYTTFFGAGATKQTVAEMSDVEFFSKFLSFVMQQASAAGNVNFDQVEILGEVPEGENIMHVLTRTHISAGEIKLEAMEVVSFTNSEGTWKTMLSGKMKGIGAQLKAALQREGQE